MAPELARALRDAFAKTLKDPEFVEEVKKRRYDLDPVSADEMQTMAREAVNQPADVVERVRKILENYLIEQRTTAFVGSDRHARGGGIQKHVNSLDFQE